MKKINLLKILEKSKLDKSEVANQLFPGNKYPDLSLNRVIQGKSFLNSEQISKLSLLTGLSIQQLFEPGNWSMRTYNNTFTFRKGDYRAELDLSNKRTLIFHNESIFHDEIIHDGFIRLSEYLNRIELLILNFENHEHNRS